MVERIKLSLAIASLVLAALAPRPGLAAPPVDDSDALVLRGVDRYKRADYEGARVAFARAFSLSSRTALLFNLALAEVQSGHAPDAVKHFRLYLSAPDSDTDKAAIIRTKWLTKAEAESGLLRVEAAAGTIILVDAELIGATPLPASIPVTAGKHRVEARRGGSLLANEVGVASGVVTPISFDMPDVRAPVVSPPAVESRLAVGASPRHVDQPSSVASSGKIITVASVGGASVLAGTIAVLFGISSHGDASYAADLRSELASSSACAASPQPPQCVRLRRALDNQYDHRDLAVGFGITAGALLAADALLFIFWPRATSTMVAAPAGTKGAMLGWRAQF
jgi:hypothetical protein